MSIFSDYEAQLLGTYLEAQDCKCAPECIESWGECCGDCPSCERYEDNEPDWETEAEDRAERMAERW